jgi:hypothetical protein
MPGKLTIGGKVALLIVGRQDLISGSRGKKASDIGMEDLRCLAGRVFPVADRVEFHEKSGVSVLKDRFTGRYGR